MRNIDANIFQRNIFVSSANNKYKQEQSERLQSLAGRIFHVYKLYNAILLIFNRGSEL